MIVAKERENVGIVTKFLNRYDKIATISNYKGVLKN